MNSHSTFKHTAFITILFAIAAALQPAARAQYDPSEVKARLIVNFMQGVRWPAKAFPDASAPFTIGVCGSDTFGEFLNGRGVAGRKVVIVRSRRVEDLRNCQIVFFAKSEGGRASDIASSLKGSNVLTVGETEGFAARGGIINFVMEGEKVRYELNAAAAQRNGLEIGSKVSRPAKPVSE